MIMDSKQWGGLIVKTIHVLITVYNEQKSVGALLPNSKFLGDKKIEGINLHKVY